MSSPRWKAGVAALLLMLAGGVLGVAADRLWLRHAHGAGMALTADALAAHLDLGPAEEARMRALLDSMHVEVAAAAAEGPEALQAVARRAYERLELALPPDARPAFRAWMEGHHHQMMRRLGGDR
jgi:hypothetical protein